MIWPFTRSKNGRKPEVAEDKADAEAEAAEAVKAAERKIRRDAAQKRIVATMREAQEAREATIAMEAVHVKATDDRRAKAETTIRKAQEKATEISDTVCPTTRPEAPA